MKRSTLPILVGMIVFAAATAAPIVVQDSARERFDEARLAWDTGDYPKALDGFEALVQGPDAARFFDRIALITGELYPTTEITTDGRAIRISPDGRFFAYDSGPSTAPVTRIVAFADPGKTVARLGGTGLVFSPAPNTAAYLRVNPGPEITALRKEIASLTAAPTPDRATLMSKQRQLSRLEARASEIVVLDLKTGKDRVLKTEGFFKGALAWSADGTEVYFVGAKESDETSNEIYAANERGTVRPLTSGPGFKTAPVAVPGGKYLLFSAGPMHPFPAPPLATQTVVPGQRGAAPAAKPQGQMPPGGRGGGRGGFGRGTRAFTVLSLADGKAKSFTGSSPALSEDGSTLAFVAQDGGEWTINAVKLEGDLTPAVIKKSADRIGSVALNGDGTTAAFDMTYTRNGEIFAIGTDGKNEIRLSRESEPDRAPRFLDAGRVMAIKGESRFSRAYIYDLKTGAPLRLFHNNTLRTIAPEYDWAADPSGTKVLIVADRDGDTISNERGVYLVDLARRISTSDLLARIASQRASELALRTKSERMFAPLRDAVLATVTPVSISKIYETEEALFNLDSKYYTFPANKLAAEYLFDQLTSYGYAPEYQPFEIRGTKTMNVIARLPGTENPDRLVVLGAHFDSVQPSPGADDNSSSVVVNLETARLLAGRPLPCTVVFVFFTGEEVGELGSREFIRIAQANKWDIVAALNNDMIGWSPDFHLADTIRFASSGLRDIQHAAAFLFSRLVTYDTRYVRSTDAEPIYAAYGPIVSGLGSYPLLGSPYYHQSTDLLENVNQALLVEAAKYNTAAVMMVASSPGPVRGLKIASLKAAAAEAAWTPNPEKAVESYVVTYGPEASPAAATVTVKEPRASLTGFQLKKGESLAVSVKAVTPGGIESWDVARVSATLK
jgi:Tol biopolymer transport system component